MEPMTMMMGGAALSSIGQLAGGLLAGDNTPSQGDMVFSHYDPLLNQALMGASTDALQLIGRGNIGSEPDPIQGLVGQIMALPLDEKSKRRGLHEMRQYLAGNDMSWGGKFFRGAIGRVGLETDGFDRLVEDRTRFREKQDRLRDAGLDGLGEQTIINRMRAANAASGLLGAAGAFADTGEINNRHMQQLLERDDRALADLRDRAGVLANFGNINPGQAFSQIMDAELSQDLRLLQQATDTANAITQGLGGANAIAQGAAGMQTQAQGNAAQLAAQQAQAANTMRQQAAMDAAVSRGNAVSGALGTFGNLGMAAGLDAMGGGGQTQNTLSNTGSMNNGRFDMFGSAASLPSSTNSMLNWTP